VAGYIIMVINFQAPQIRELLDQLPNKSVANDASVSWIEDYFCACCSYIMAALLELQRKMIEATAYGSYTS
jgi:hypothetical protein